MWLTGFDVKCLATLYLDKPMQGHTLMQAIARVNRVFKDKPGGLIVDYIGILQNLKNALADYSPSDQDKTGIDEEQAVAALREAFERVRAVFHGHDYSAGLTGTPKQRLHALAGAIDWVLRWQEQEAGKATNAEDKKRAHRAFQDMVLELSKAYALASASDLAGAIRDEVGFIQTVRAAIAKSTVSGGLGVADRAFAVQQLIDRAVASSEIIDVLRAAGVESPDISILSDEFLAEIRGMERKNLALDALQKLLNGEIRSRAKTNVVESRTFSRRLEEAVARYHANAISAVEMINELIALAKDLQEARRRGEEQGLSQEEVAFYDALAQNESAIQALGNDTLRLIAHELLEQLTANATVDWHKRESARARMRVLVKRILKKYGYPPDLADDAVKTVLEQAEVLLRQLV
jgi:type I restriction enzyme R subunit